MAFSLHSVAPRLARARDEREAEHRQDVVKEMRLIDARLRADRLLAHRELQDIRAIYTKNPKYMRYRRRKLDVAREQRKKLG